MVGLGTQDDLRQAQQFLRRHKLSSVRLLWDATGVSWVRLRLAAQPAWLLIAANGTVAGSDLGAIPYRAVLDAI